MRLSSALTLELKSALLRHADVPRQQRQHHAGPVGAGEVGVHGEHDVVAAAMRDAVDRRLACAYSRQVRPPSMAVVGADLGTTRPVTSRSTGRTQVSGRLQRYTPLRERWLATGSLV